MKVIFPLLLTLLLFACSTNQTATPQKNENCTQINIVEQILQFRSLNDNILDNFNENYPTIKEDIIFTIDDIDMHRKKFAMVFESPGLSNPKTGYLRNLVSDELFDYNKTLKSLELDKIREDIKTYIPDYEKHRCHYEKSDNYRLLYQ